MILILLGIASAYLSVAPIAVFRFEMESFFTLRQITSLLGGTFLSERCPNFYGRTSQKFDKKHLIFDWTRLT